MMIRLTIILMLIGLSGDGPKKSFKDVKKEIVANAYRDKQQEKIASSLDSLDYKMDSILMILTDTIN